MTILAVAALLLGPVGNAEADWKDRAAVRTLNTRIVKGHDEKYWLKGVFHAKHSKGAYSYEVWTCKSTWFDPNGTWVKVKSILLHHGSSAHFEIPVDSEFSSGLIWVIGSGHYGSERYDQAEYVSLIDAYPTGAGFDPVKPGGQIPITWEPHSESYASLLVSRPDRIDFTFETEEPYDPGRPGTEAYNPAKVWKKFSADPSPGGDWHFVGDVPPDGTDLLTYPVNEQRRPLTILVLLPGYYTESGDALSEISGVARIYTSP